MSARAQAFDSMAASPMLFTLASVLGLGLQISSLLVIRSAGSVTLKLLGIVRNAALVVVEILRGNAHASGLQLAGYGLSLAAFGEYTRVQLTKPKPKAA